MDRIGSWNVRGLNSLTKHNDVKSFLNHYNIGLFGLLETRVKARNFSKVFPRIFHGWSVVTNYLYHNGGRIWLIWLPSVFVVNVCSYDAHFIHYEVLHRAYGKSFDVTVVYGANDASIREDMWCALDQI